MGDSDFDNFECPECHNEGAYFNGSFYECPDCGREWDDHKVFKHGDDYQRDDTDLSERLVEFIEESKTKNKSILIEKPCSFHGNLDEKFKYIYEVEDWLNNIFAGKISETSYCVLEDPDEFSIKLGLPIWLINFLGTLRHHNIKYFYNRSLGEQKHIYLRFLILCNVGVDYSLLFHKWEILLFKKYLPEQEREKPIFKSLISLHENALSGLVVNKVEWQDFSDEVEVLMGTMDKFPKGSLKFAKKADKTLEKLNEMRGTRDANYAKQQEEYFLFENIKKAFGQITWDSYRAAFLSAQEAIDANEVWASSTEAIVDARWQGSLISSDGTTRSFREGKPTYEEISRHTDWEFILDDFLTVLMEWK